MTDHTPPAAGEGPADPARRRLLTRAGLGLSALVGALVGLPVIGFLLSPLIRPPAPQWVDLGPVERYGPDSTTLVAFDDLSSLPWAGLTSRTAVYVQRLAAQEFRVFAVNCTHLGCPVNWLPAAQLFLCPCHGGVFYRNGQVAAGPPPRPLYQYHLKVEGGHLFVQTQPLPPAPPALLRRRGMQT